jgi:hypothetical protein
MLNDEIYAAILKEYKESGCELFDEMFLTQFTYVGGLTPINSPKEKKTK